MRRWARMNPCRRSTRVSRSALAACKQFQRDVNRGNYRRAFATFEAQPALVNHIPLQEIPRHCEELDRHLGERKAVRFLREALRTLADGQRKLAPAKMLSRRGERGQRG